MRRNARNVCFLNPKQRNFYHCVYTFFSYHRVRYEDLVESPFETAKQIYKFTGQPWTKDVENFIKTHTESSTHMMTWRKTPQNPNLRTHKDYKSYKQTWKTQLNAKQIRRIQKNCRNVMKKLHYNHL